MLRQGNKLETPGVAVATAERALGGRRTQPVDAKPHGMAPHQSKPLLLSSNPALIIGFGIVITLFTVLTALALARLDGLQNELEDISHRRLVKIGSVGEMRRAARAGTVRLQNMLLISDPTARGQEWHYFRRLAADFVSARESLTAQPLIEEERAILDQLMDLARIAQPLQQRVAELALEGRLGEAHHLLISSAIPAQDRMLLELERLHRLQEDAVEAESAAALARYEHTRESMMILAALAIILGLSVAFLVVRRAVRAERSLHAEKEQALVTLYSIGEAVITTDQLGEVQYLNSVAEKLTGFTASSARGRALGEVVDLRRGDAKQSAEELVNRALRSGSVVRANGDLVLVTPRDEERAIELTSSPMCDPRGRVRGVVHVISDVTAVRAMRRELAYHATHDSLTGLINRREFERRLQTAIARSHEGDIRHALIYIDLDLFQVVNDTAGHIAGDELLRQLASLLESRVHASDVVARTGGDEFAVLIEHCPAQEAVLTAKDLLGNIKGFRFLWNDRSFDLGASIGVVPIGPRSGSVYDVLRAADLACYVAKDSGRNRVHLFDSKDAALVHREGEMHRMQQVREALENQRFILYQQAIEPIGAKADTCSLHEILLRMHAPSGELLAPQAFLPAAEHYQLGPQVDRWVIGETLRALNALHDRPASHGTVFSINVSGQSLDDPSFVDFVLTTLRDTGTAAEAICFEITETAAIGHLARARELMEVLKMRGCLFALDDFGSGSSSFAYLKKLPVDFLKIDGQFVRDIARDSTDRALVESINQIGHVMGMRTIAEYVEDDEVKRLLVKIGVDFVQGDAIAKPAPLKALWSETQEHQTDPAQAQA